jgi:hypothetical protein
MIAGPAGMRCPDCAALRSTSLYRIPPARLALAIFAGLVTGVVGAIVMTLPFVGFFVFFVGPIYGGIVAEAILRAAGRKRGRILEVIGIGSIALGALLVCVVPLLLVAAALHAAHGIPAPNGSSPPATAPVPAASFLTSSLVGFLWPLLGCALAISTCYARLKYW